jgi:DNA-binding transcriptional regulator LsrR (DeoR family)
LEFRVSHPLQNLRVLDLASRADIVFLGMGALAFCEPGTLFYEIILAAGSSPKQLRENYGAVGDILFQLLDKEGNLIQDSPLEKKFKNCSINRSPKFTLLGQS